MYSLMGTVEEGIREEKMVWFLFSISLTSTILTADVDQSIRKARRTGCFAWLELMGVKYGHTRSAHSYSLFSCWSSFKIYRAGKYVQQSRGSDGYHVSRLHQS